MKEIAIYTEAETGSRSDSKDVEKTGSKDLPHDLITQNILTRLPIKSLVRCKSVSKQWYSTLSSPEFARTHLKFPHTLTSESLLIRWYNKFKFLSYENGEMNLVNINVDFGPVKENLVVAGSCNGLVCLGSDSSLFFILWNPITTEVRSYPDDSEINEFSSKGCEVTWGFGYVSAIDDYKVLRISKQVVNQSISVHIFSTRLDKWKRIEVDSSFEFFSPRQPLVLIRETLYWIGKADEGWQRKIFGFNLGLESFNTFLHLNVGTPAAWARVDDYRYDENIFVANGCLSKFSTFFPSGDGAIAILKRTGETEQILVSKGLLGLSCPNLIGFTRSDKFFTQYHDGYKGRLGIFDPSSRPMKHTQLMTLDFPWTVELPRYSATLISPSAIATIPEDFSKKIHVRSSHVCLK